MTVSSSADEQEPMTGTDFAAWRASLGLSLSEAATLLGVGRRTIMGYLKRDELPTAVAIACRALAHDHIFWRRTTCRREGPCGGRREAGLRFTRALYYHCAKLPLC